MPELPEVETIARTLRDGRGGYQVSVIGALIREAVILWPRTVAAPSPGEFEQKIKGQSIKSLKRRGKFLVFSLTNDVLLIHLRMSGDLRLEPAHNEVGGLREFLPHDRMALVFTNGARLVFNDTRKFGRAWLVANAGVVTGGLGPEPLDESLNGEKFHRMLKGRKRQLKPLLMDQTFLAGLGNIYTDEALHRAKLHPLALASGLTSEDAGRLLSAIRAALAEGIQRNGASIDWVYRGGEFQNYFRVYGRAGQACPVCGALIQRLVVGQRGTHICPDCQRLQRD